MLYDYFINSKIIIYDKDDIQTKIEKYIIKYHKIIGIILLVIFFIIVYCHSSIINVNINLQTGGAGAVAPLAVATVPAVVSAPVAGAVASSAGISSTAVASLATSSSALSKLNISNVKGLQNKSKMMEKLTKFSRDGKKYASEGIGGLSDYSRRTASVIKGYSPIFYRILYTVAFTLIVAIVVLPSVIFLIIGIVCYFLLQKNMDYIKKL